MRDRDSPLWNDEPPLELDPTAEPAIPLAPGARVAPEGHVSFNGFWASLGLPEDEANERLRELFFEWLGQNGYDVQDRDEPTILGDLLGWREVWARYRATRRLE